MSDNAHDVQVRVGRAVKSLRQLRGYSQEELAGLIGHDPKYIGLIERGNANVTLTVLTDLARALSAKVGDFLGPASEHPPTLYARQITKEDLEIINKALRVVARLKRASGGRVRSRRN